MRVFTGFWVDEIRPKEGGLDVYVRSPAGGPSVDRSEELVPMQPREQFSGLIPFLALIGASAGLPWRRRLFAVGVGVLAMFVFHLGLMLMAPFMTGLPQARLGLAWMRRINTMIDIVYGFYGLVGYAALPFLLWWALTQRRRAPSSDNAPSGRPRRASAPAG
jgi:hypothetical protein